jgi:hypothetical protein
LRIQINLASTPYENARRFFVQWGAALAIMVAVTVFLVVAATRSWQANHALARSISEERGRLTQLNDQEKADLAILDQPQNREIRERSDALNALILRKSVSWTRIFSDLEKMMPTRLHVVSITPQLSATNELQIRMVVAGSSRDKAIELVQNMEKSPDFRNPQTVSENTNTVKGGAQPADLVSFDIVAEYVPSNASPEPKGEAAAAGAASEQQPAEGSGAKLAKSVANNARPARSGQPKGGRP